MLCNSSKEFKLYIELFCEKIKVPYIVFALIYTNWVFPLTLLLSSSLERTQYITWLIKYFGVLTLITGVLMVIMIRRLRDVSVEIFLDPDMPFPLKIKENMSESLYAIFSPYKFVTPPSWFNKYFHNHLYPAVIISISAGIIGFSLNYYDPFQMQSNLLSGIAIALLWFVFVIMAYMIIGVILLLREILGELKNENQFSAFIHVKKIAELKHIILNILYSYTAVIISLPTNIKYLKTIERGTWVYGNIFMFVMGLLGFIIVLTIPTYYVGLIIKNVKNKYKIQRFSTITDLESKIFTESATDLDLKKYEMLMGMIEKVEKITVWPSDLTNITKIIITGVVSIFPTLLKIFLENSK